MPNKSQPYCFTRKENYEYLSEKKRHFNRKKKVKHLMKDMQNIDRQTNFFPLRDQSNEL